MMSEGDAPKKKERSKQASKSKISRSESKPKSTTKSKSTKTRKEKKVEEVFLEDGEDEQYDVEEVQQKEAPWLFTDHNQFLKELLQTSIQEIGPYVPFCESKDQELASWKCLNLLRALG
jgi:hypothetical protein